MLYDTIEVCVISRRLSTKVERSSDTLGSLSWHYKNRKYYKGCSLTLIFVIAFHCLEEQQSKKTFISEVGKHTAKKFFHIQITEQLLLDLS